MHRSDDVGAHAANAPPAIRTVASLHVLHSKGAETTFRPSIQSVSTHDVAIVASHQRTIGHAARESAEPVRLQRADTHARHGRHVRVTTGVEDSSLQHVWRRPGLQS